MGVEGVRRGSLPEGADPRPIRGSWHLAALLLRFPFYKHRSCRFYEQCLDWVAKHRGAWFGWSCGQCPHSPFRLPDYERKEADHVCPKCERPTGRGRARSGGCNECKTWTLVAAKVEEAAMQSWSPLMEEDEDSSDLLLP